MSNNLGFTHKEKVLGKYLENEKSESLEAEFMFDSYIRSSICDLSSKKDNEYACQKLCYMCHNNNGATYR
jgi:hypothetical protein